MKDFMLIWTRLAGRRYSSVNVNQNNSDSSESEEMTISQKTNSLRRKSSVVVNRFFNTALPVHSHSVERPNRFKNIFTLMTLGLLGLSTGCVLLVFQPYELIFKLKLVFGDGGEIFEIWRKPQVELYLKVYVFNVTNHEEYLSGKDAKLRFQEIGPYVYRELVEHGNIQFNDNGTLTAVPIHPLIYVPEMSNGTEQDIVIVPNIALLSITNVMRDSSYFTRLGLNVLIRHTNTQPLVKMTAREFLFGYESTLVTLGNKMMPSWIKFDKLGLIDRMYDFEGDYETVYTGETDSHLTGLIEKYNGDVNLPQWTGKCGNVNGASDGVKFPSYIQPNQSVLFYRKSLCRSERMVRTGEKTIGSLYTYEYKFVENELDNGLYNPENKCFCRNGFCLKAGLIDVTDCYYGFPIALSYPHFFKTDPTVLEAVEGLNPKAELHETYAYVQPKSGLPVNLAFRFQINMFMQEVQHMAHVEKFANLVVPLLWFEIGMYELPAPMRIKFWFYLNALPIMQDAMIYSLLFAGIVLIIFAVYKILLCQPKRTTGARQWLDTELEKHTLHFLGNRRMSNMTKEMDTYYSSLLESKEGNTSPDAAETVDLPCLKEEIV